MPILMTLPATADEGNGVVAVFLVLAVVLALAKILGELFLRLGQPAVVGELIAGVILGPTFLHIVAAPIDGAGAAEETISILAQLGVLWLMFGAGLEVDLGDFRRAGRPASLAASLGVILPMLAGAGLGLAFGYTSSEAVFLGLVLSATSVSISAQTLLEMGRLRSPVGTALLGAAVLDDILVIVLLSVFVGIETGDGSLAGVGSQIGVMALVVSGVALVAWVALPRVAQLGHRMHVSQGALALVLASVLLLAWATEDLGGMAAITGAFLAGVGMARSHLREEIERGLAPLAFAFFVPLFLANIGLQANLRTLRADGLIFGLLLLLLAGLSKFAGAGLGARLGGMSGRPSVQLGIGMISRGEVGLIVAGVGVAGGLLTEDLFAAVVLMVIGTTLATPFLLRWAFRREEDR